MGRERKGSKFFFKKLYSGDKFSERIFLLFCQLFFIPLVLKHNAAYSVQYSSNQKLIYCISKHAKLLKKQLKCI